MYPASVDEKIYPAVVDKKYSSWWLPLHQACFSGCQPEVTTLLLEVFPREATVADQNGCLPLHFVVTKDPMVGSVSSSHICEVCASPEDAEKMLLCDRCNEGYHLHCLPPPLLYIPPGDWYCNSCIAAMRDVERSDGARKGGYNPRGLEVVKLLLKTHLGAASAHAKDGTLYLHCAEKHHTATEVEEVLMRMMPPGRLRAKELDRNRKRDIKTKSPVVTAGQDYVREGENNDRLRTRNMARIQEGHKTELSRWLEAATEQRCQLKGANEASGLGGGRGTHNSKSFRKPTEAAEAGGSREAGEGQ